MSRPEVSVIISTYQDEINELKESITSVLHQEKVSQEIILVMVSDDPNTEIAKAWIPKINDGAQYSKIRLHVCRESEHPGKSPDGSFFQINAGLKYATKDYIRWFSGDDILYPRSTITQIEALQKSGKKVSYGGYTLLDRDNKVAESVKFFPYNRLIHQRTNFINDVALFDSSLIKYLPFEFERWGNYAFWHFWLTVFENEGDQFEYTDQVLWAYRIREKSEHVARLKRPGGKQEYARFRRALQNNHPIR